MLKYATREATVELVESLGFVKVAADDENYFDSSGVCNFELPIIQLRLYICLNGYWCVDANEGWMAPVVWNGPRTPSNSSNQKNDFITWLDKHYPGWK